MADSHGVNKPAAFECGVMVHGKHVWGNMEENVGATAREDTSYNSSEKGTFLVGLNHSCLVIMFSLNLVLK